MTELFLTIGILQLFVPPLLLFWQWREHSTSKAQWLFKTILATSYLTAIAVAGLWSLIPFFVPYLYLGLSFVFAARGFFRIRAIPLWRAEAAWKRINFGITVLLAVASFVLAIYALSGWNVPPGDAARLAFPLKNGTYYIVNGGSIALLNAHLETLEDERFRPLRGQSYAVDILKINRWGLRASGFLPEDLTRYAIFGEPIYAPCAGTVIETENGRDDITPPEPDREVMAGNRVLIDCGEVIILLAHFKKGSVAVATGQAVEVGQTLGQVGNSGNTNEPHLHIHAQRRGSTKTSLDGEPVWMLFDREFLVRNQLIAR